MISTEREAEIVRLFHAERWRVGTIASQLGIHHSTVRRVLNGAGVDLAATLRPSMADPFVPFIIETLKKYPRLRASRLFHMVRERGYPGGEDHFRAVVARYRPRPDAEAYQRLRTLPGEQAQTDWGKFGKIRVGRAERRLAGFIMTLSWSRRRFLRFYYSEVMANFLRGHVEAFAYFRGIPRVNLYDNLKSAVIERVGDAIRFNEAFLELAKHYRFEPRPVAPFRGNEKGRVERSVRFIRDSFFAAREFTDIEDLNAQALAWCDGIAADRPCPEDRTMTVREAFEREQPHLLALPANPFVTDEKVPVSVGKTPYVRFDLNDYSVPHSLVRRSLLVSATLSEVRVLDGNQVVATHPRSFDRDGQIEDPSHVAALAERKSKARKQRGMDRLHHAVPSTRNLLIGIAERGGNLGSTVNRLTQMLDAHGAQALDEAVREALAHGAPHLAAIHQVLDRRRRDRGQGPAIPVQLPDNPRVRNLVVRPHALADYDALGRQQEDCNP
jgi:transposase